MQKIKLKLSPKGLKIFSELMLTAGAYAGPEQRIISSARIIHTSDMETGEERTTAEPYTIVVNRTLSQKLAGKFVNFVQEHVEVETKRQR